MMMAMATALTLAAPARWTILVQGRLEPSRSRLVHRIDRERQAFDTLRSMIAERRYSVVTQIDPPSAAYLRAA